METKSRLSKRRNDALPSLNAAIDALDLARDTTSSKQARDAFCSASTLLVTTRDSVINEVDFVDLGLSCADICQSLDQEIKGRGVPHAGSAILEAIEQLTTTMGDVQRHIIKRGKRSVLSRPFHRSNDEAISAWKLELDRIRRAVETELTTNRDLNDPDVIHVVSGAYATVPDLNHAVPDTGVTENHHPAVVSQVHPEATYLQAIVPEAQGGLADSHTTAPSIFHNNLEYQVHTDDKNRPAYATAPEELPPPLPKTVPGTLPAIQHAISKMQRTVDGIKQTLESREDGDRRNQATRTSVLGESPPTPPRACFGRDEIIERIVSLAENLNPVALIGAGGIGKTSIALTLLHHCRIKERFGDNRRFIRCDQFTASQANFLNRLSKAVGAGIENPEDLGPLRPFLSSTEMLVVLDNAESILDPKGVDAQEIFGVVEELGQISNICLIITSRITTVPPDCKRLDIPTLSADAAHKAFHRIYDNNERPDLVGEVLEQLEFHPLSVSLLATVAHQNRWDIVRLAKEWEKRRTGVLQPKHNKSLADTIELSLASPLFKDLGYGARDLLGVIAFFPQGVNEDNIDWLFPAIPNLAAALDTFCILSLTYRHDGFLTMLVPLRDYLRPEDPLSSPLLCTATESYTTRLSRRPDPNAPEFGETRWIASEDVNVEHLLDVLTSINADSDNVWCTCGDFLYYLYWRKPRRTVLGPKIEALPDDHPDKSDCLRDLAWLMGSTGNHTEQKRLLEYILKSARERGDDEVVASTLTSLSDANRRAGFLKEGIDQAKEASEIFERIGRKENQGDSLIKLAFLLYEDKQLDAAEEAATRAIKLLPEKGQEFWVCQSHRVLGLINRSKGRREEAIHHFETAIRIATPPNWEYLLFWNHYSLAELFRDEDDFDNAHGHIERAKSHAVDNAYNLGRAVELQAAVYYRQDRLLDARSEALRALEIYRRFGAARGQERCEHLLHKMDVENSRSTSGESDSSTRTNIVSVDVDDPQDTPVMIMSSAPSPKDAPYRGD